MRALVEIVDRQVLHLLEDGLSQSEHRALADMDHQSIVGVGADSTEEEHQSQFEERLC